MKRRVWYVLEAAVCLEDPDHRGIVSAFRHDLGNQPSSVVVGSSRKVAECRNRPAVCSCRTGLDALQVLDARRIDTSWNSSRLPRVARIVSLVDPRYDAVPSTSVGVHDGETVDEAIFVQGLPEGSFGRSPVPHRKLRAAVSSVRSWPRAAPSHVALRFETANGVCGVGS